MRREIGEKSSLDALVRLTGDKDYPMDKNFLVGAGRRVTSERVGWGRNFHGADEVNTYFKQDADAVLQNIAGDKQASLELLQDRDFVRNGLLISNAAADSFEQASTGSGSADGQPVGKIYEATSGFSAKMKILIVKLSSIGDIVHTLPALAAIRRALPDARISWAVERGAAEILRGNGLINRLVEIDTRSLRVKKISRRNLSDARKHLRELRAETFDVALDFQGLLKSASIARLAGAERVFGFAKPSLREPASRFLLTETFEAGRVIHICEKNLTLAAKALNIAVPGAPDFEFPIFTDEIHKSEAAQIVARTGADFAILNPAGGWATKLWHAPKFGALADKLWEENRLPSVVTTAPNEIELAQKVLRNSKSGKVLLAQPSLKGFYELAKRARIYIGGDTAPTHLAVAARAPVVGIFGATEWWRNGSPNPSDICVERADIACRADCHRRACDNWICMDIEVETVLRAAQKRLELAAAENVFNRAEKS